MQARDLRNREIMNQTDFKCVTKEECVNSFINNLFVG